MRGKAVYTGLLSAGFRGDDSEGVWAYDTAWDNYPKYMVSMDEVDMSRNGIKHRNVREFSMGRSGIRSIRVSGWG